MEINLDLTTQQSEAFYLLIDNYSKVTEILYGGAAGGGKSYLGCLWIIYSALRIPKSRWLMGRSKLSNLEKTTLDTFHKICNTIGLTEEHYKYNLRTNIIKFYNGSEVILKDLFYYPSDPDCVTLGGLELTGCFIDEASEIHIKPKNVVGSRVGRCNNFCHNCLTPFKKTKEEAENGFTCKKCNTPTDGIPGKTLMTTNPGPGWVYDEFYVKNREGTLEDYKKFIVVTSEDNIYLPKSYIKGLDRLPRKERDRLLLGLWELDSDDCLIEYDNIISMFKMEQYTKPLDNIYISCDVARKGKDKAVIYVWNNFDIIETHILDVSLINQIVNLIGELKHKYGLTNNRNIVIDGDGVGGGVVDFLPGCIDFVNNSRPLNGDNYQNLKTQCYFKLAEHINSHIINIYNMDDDKMRNLSTELTAVRYKNVNSDGKLQMITKEDMKRLLSRSPDYADAMMLRMYFSLKPEAKVTFRI